MNKFKDIEKSVEQKYEQKDKRKTPKMHQSGKSVFNLQKLITKKHDSSSRRKNSKKN